MRHGFLWKNGGSLDCGPFAWSAMPHFALMAEIRRLLAERVPVASIVALLRCSWADVNEAVASQ